MDQFEQYNEDDIFNNNYPYQFTNLNDNNMDFFNQPNIQENQFNNDDFSLLQQDEQQQQKQQIIIKDEEEDNFSNNDHFPNQELNKQSSFLEPKLESPLERNDFLDHKFPNLSKLYPEQARKFEIIAGLKKRTIKEKIKWAKYISKQKQQYLQIQQQQDLSKQENNLVESAVEANITISNQIEENLSNHDNSTQSKTEQENSSSADQNKNNKNINRRNVKGSGKKTENKKDKQKKQRLRNRVSAQQSRDRKKAYIQDLEEKNQKYEQENEFLKQRIQTLIQEEEFSRKQNLNLKGQLQDLKKKHGEIKEESLENDQHFQDSIIENQKKPFYLNGNFLTMTFIVTFIAIACYFHSKSDKPQSNILTGEQSIQFESNPGKFEISAYTGVNKSYPHLYTMKSNYSSLNNPSNIKEEEEDLSQAYRAEAVVFEKNQEQQQQDYDDKGVKDKMLKNVKPNDEKALQVKQEEQSLYDKQNQYGIKQEHDNEQESYNNSPVPFTQTHNLRSGQKEKNHSNALMLQNQASTNTQQFEAQENRTAQNLNSLKLTEGQKLYLFYSMNSTGISDYNGQNLHTNEDNKDGIRGYLDITCTIESIKPYNV